MAVGSDAVFYYTIAYAVCVFLGGLYGFLTKGSKASVIAASVCWVA